MFALLSKWLAQVKKIYDEAPGRPESIEDYNHRRKAADDDKFRAFLEKKRREANAER